MYVVQDRAVTLLAKATILHTELAAVFATSQFLIYRGRERRLSSTYPLLRVIRGGSDACVIAEMITDTAMCLPCISKRTGVPIEQVNAVLRSITGTFRLSIGMRRCAVCRARKTAFGISTDGNSSHHTNGATRSAIVSFLEEHRGEAFCSRCISFRLFEGRDIDVAMRHLEGSGLARRHGRCAACGMPRLVASVPSTDN